MEKLWRASQAGLNEQTIRVGDCFASSRWDAEAYLEANQADYLAGGYGGDTLYSVTVKPANVLWVDGSDGAERFCEAVGLSYEEQLSWGNRLVWQIWEGNEQEVLAALQEAGYDWVVYEDDCPVACETWRWTGVGTAPPLKEEEI